MAILDDLYVLLHSDTAWIGIEQELTDLREKDWWTPQDFEAYTWASEAAEQGDTGYSTALTLALAEAAAAAFEEHRHDAFRCFYHAALATGAPSAVRGRVARRMLPHSIGTAMTVLYNLQALGLEEALEIGQSALRLDELVLQHSAVDNLIDLVSEAERLGGEVDCCEVLDTSPDPPSPFVRAAHFMLAASLPGRLAEALDVHLPQLAPCDYEDDSPLNSGLVELADIYFDQVTVYSALAIAARTWAAVGTAAPEWIDAILAPVIEGLAEADFAGWDGLDPWSSVYWAELEEVVAASEQGALELLAYEALEVLADKSGHDADTRAIAADVIGLLVERWPAVAARMMLAEALAELVYDGDFDLDGDETVWMSVARALGGFAWLPQAELDKELSALALLRTSSSEDVREQAHAATARLSESSGHPDLPVDALRAGHRTSDWSGDEWLTSLGLYRWQSEALRAWTEAGRRGVIEAVTGAGKTRVALAAIAEAVLRGYAVAVLVPSVELLRQWRREIEQRLLDHARLTFSVGQMGAGESETLVSCDVLLATLSSASRYQLQPPAAVALLIVDEVHRAGAPTWAAALEPGFNQRLGLTATYEREDLGVEEHLDPYFGGVCASVGYGEALRDGVIAPFKVAHVGVRFTPSEQAEYDRFAKQAADRRRQLIDDWECPAEPFGEFLRAVHRLSASGIPEGSRAAGFYLSAFSKRRAVLSNATAKFSRLQDLTAAVHAAEKTIVFTQTKQAAADAVAALADGQIAGSVLHAGMDLDARAKVFGGFEDGTHELVAAPRLLDEGVDVPAADLGIVIAASRSRRQMIQRMGRILRRKSDGRPARFVIMYVEGSSEDPEQPGHEGFLELITPYALDVQRFDGTATATAINTYLAPQHIAATTSAESELSVKGHGATDEGQSYGKESGGSRGEAELSYTETQFTIGVWLEQAEPPDLEEARHYYTTAAEAGHTKAQYNLGLLLFKSDPPELEEARHWWSLAAAAGHANAQHNLEILLRDDL